MKKIRVILAIGIGLVMAISGCGKKDGESQIESYEIEEEMSIDNNEDNSTDDSVDNSEAENLVEETKEIHSDDEYYISRLTSEKGISKDDILSVKVYEYEGGNLYSAFIFVGKEDLDFGNYIGQVWFVSEDSVQSIFDEEMEFYSTGDVLSFSNTDKAFFYVDEYYVTQAVSHVYGVENGKAVEQVISRLGAVSPKDNNDFSITVSAYDNYISSDDDFPIGHTWKPYYFSYDETKNDFVEYVGKQLTEDKLSEICTSPIVQEIKELGGTIMDIFIRDNGIITVNYQITTYYDGGGHEITYSNANYDVNSQSYIDVWEEGIHSLSNSDYGGTYSAALLPMLLNDGHTYDVFYDQFTEDENLDSNY